MKHEFARLTRPPFGIGVLIGAAVLVASQASGSDSVLGAVLGAGAGLALGLSRTRGTEEQLPGVLEGHDEERE